MRIWKLLVQKQDLLAYQNVAVKSAPLQGWKILTTGAIIRRCLILLGLPKLLPSLPLDGVCLCVTSAILLWVKGSVIFVKKTQKQSNLAEMVKSSSLRSKSKVTSEVLKNICSDSGVTLKGGEIKLSTGGKSLPVKVGAPENLPKTPRFSHDSLKRLQAAYDFSDRATK